MEARIINFHRDTGFRKLKILGINNSYVNETWWDREGFSNPSFARYL